jgi:hypothetical protein
MKLIFLSMEKAFWIVVGFSLMVLIYVLYYHWRSQFIDEVQAERGIIVQQPTGSDST